MLVGKEETSKQQEDYVDLWVDGSFLSEQLLVIHKDYF